MQKENSLIAAYLIDKDGSGKKLTWSQVEKWSPEQGMLWVHLNYAIKRSTKWLSKNAGLSKIIIEAMTNDESRPRCVVHKNGTLIALRGVNLNPGQDREDMVSIRAWLGEGLIVTTRRRKVLTISDISAKIEAGAGPKSPVAFLKMLITGLLERVSDVVEDITEKVDSLDDRIVNAESRLLRPEIADIRRQSIALRRYLSPQREALNKLYTEYNPLFDDSDRLHFRESADKITRYIEDLDSARERATVTQEELSSKISEQLDKRIYILSVVTVIFLPLSFITGLLGINVGGIPGADNPFGFITICSVLVGLLLLITVFLYKKKWL